MPNRRVTKDFNDSSVSVFLRGTNNSQPDRSLPSGLRTFVANNGQIRDGASFDVFLSADSERPQELVDESLAVPDPIVYAIGTLALYSRDLDLSVDGDALLASAAFATLAIADPETAPYGRAAIQTLDSMGLRESLQDTLAIGENVGKTLDLLESGNAEAGFVAFPDFDARRPQA